MNNKKRNILIVILLGLSLGLSLVMANRTFAINTNSIVSKAVFEGVYGCFNGGAFNKTFYASNPAAFILNNGATDAVKLPYGMTNVGDNNLNCKEVMMGYDNSNGIKGGLIPSNIRTSGADVTTVKNYFAGQSAGSNGLPAAGAAATTTVGGIGYKAEGITEGTSGVKKTLTYTISDFNCISGESNPNFGGSKKTITFPTVVSTDSGLKITSYNDISSNGANFAISNCGNLKLNVGIPIKDTNSITFDVYLGASGDGYQTITYTKNGNDIAITDNRGLSIADGQGNYVNLNPSSSQASAGNTTISDYKLTWGGGNWTALLKGLNGNNRAGISVNQVYAGYNYLALTRQEFFDLYVHYIENSNIFNAKIVAEGQNDYSGVDVNLCSNKKYKVNKTNSTTRSSVYGVNSDLHFNAGPLSLDDVISMLSSKGPYDDIDNGGRCNSNKNESSDGGSTGGSSTAREGMCDDLLEQYAGGNIGAMQWVLCPTMDNTSYTADWVDNITQNMLEIQADSYSGLGDTWGEVRNIANVLITIFLLVVIFSQLTGRGIDNYGIKKMLPRIIMMAIIVNLSLYICQIAVDLSNILGSGLRDMFGGMGGSPSGGANYVTGAITGIFAAAASGGGAAAGAAATALAVGAAGWVAVVIAIIVLVLVIIVAVAILWLMVGARQVIVIFCILISPLAFAAFILPNTQNLFKKWWELFKAALVIFPICGAVSGISAMIRNMVDNGSIQLGTAGNLIVMVLPFLVFFLLPMLLKQAIAALGKVGGALTALGTTVKTGAKNIGNAAAQGAKGTEAFKNRQLEVARRRQSDSSQRTIEKLDALKKQREAEGKTLTATETRRLARAHETQRKLGLEDEAARTILMEKEYANAAPEEIFTDWEKAGFDEKEADMDRFSALTNVISSMGPSGVSEIANRLGKYKIFNDEGGFTNKTMENAFSTLRTNMSQNKNFKNDMQNKAGDAFQMISKGGYYSYKDANDNKVTARGNLDMHARYNGVTSQTKDWMTQGSDMLKRAAEQGTLSPKVAREILTSTDPAVQSGIQTDTGKKRILMAAASGQLATVRNASAEKAHEAWTGKGAKDRIDKAAEYYQNFGGGFTGGAGI